MTHEDLLDIIAYDEGMEDSKKVYASLRAVVELHKPMEVLGYETWYGLKAEKCEICPDVRYPCTTIQAIEKELE